MSELCLRIRFSGAVSPENVAEHLADTFNDDGSLQSVHDIDIRKIREIVFDTALAIADYDNAKHTRKLERALLLLQGRELT